MQNLKPSVVHVFYSTLTKDCPMRGASVHCYRCNKKHKAHSVAVIEEPSGHGGMFPMCMPCIESGDVDACIAALFDRLGFEVVIGQTLTTDEEAAAWEKQATNATEH